MSLYRSYANNHTHYEQTLAALGEPPPVMIVVCPNTIVSKLVFEWIAGREIERPDGMKVLLPGRLELLSNVQDGAWTPRQRPIIVASVQLESGDPLGGDFKRDAAREIEAFKQAYRLRDPRRRTGRADRRRPAAPSDEHDRQTRQARRAHPLRGIGGDAERGMGRQHGHPHPRNPAVPQPTALRAGGRPRAPPPKLRRRRGDAPLRARLRRGLRRAVRLHPV
jgi:hypothetical protein